MAGTWGYEGIACNCQGLETTLAGLNTHLGHVLLACSLLLWMGEGVQQKCTRLRFQPWRTDGRRGPLIDGGR